MGSEMCIRDSYVIGQIRDVRAYQFSGSASEAILMQAIAQAPANVRTELSTVRQQIGADLDTSLSDARKTIKDRLRGPGAGGGY